MAESYTERLLRERPTHTKGGTPITIERHRGRVYVITNTGQSRSGRPSVYCPGDFPDLFGWKRTGSKRTAPPLFIVYKQHKYLRLLKTRYG